MPKWTDEQLNAIGAYNHPTIVSAAAGSGKTAVLVERTIRLLSDEEKSIPADSLLAVTFTNDAASQMREKLSAAFEALLADNPDSEWLSKQHSLLRLAEITTINAFCYGLVKDNLEKTPFRTGVRIMEENEAEMLTDRALTDVLESRYSSSPDQMEWLIASFCKENDKQLRVIIKQLYKFLRTLPYRDLWIDNRLSNLRDGTQTINIIQSFRRLASNEANALRVVISKLRSMCEGVEYHSNDRRVMETSCDIAEVLCDTVDSSDWETCIQAFHGLKFPSRSGRQTAQEKKSASSVEQAIFESAVKVFDSMKKVASDLGKYFKYPADVIAADSLAVADLFEALCDICRDLDNALLAVKVEKNALDFADTELITVSLLTRIDENSQILRTPLCEEIVSSQRYRLIIIDEFQDVNDLQNVIFKAISDTDDLDLIGSNVFVVGDAKQAIYRFRRSNPMIFTNTRIAAKDDSTDVREVLLTKNFRSRQNVLDFCNYIFASLMSTAVGEIDYNKDEALNLGAEYDGCEPSTELIFIDTDVPDEEEEFEALSPSEFEAVALRIRQMLDEGTPVKDGDSCRPCVPGDFCVLTRNNISDPDLLECFSQVGLKVVSNDRSGYLGSREISLLLNVLSCICTPMRDIPMASVMLSPILGFTDDELALVKLVSMKSRLYKNMLRISLGETSLSEELTAKCKYAVALFKKLRVYSAGMSLVSLIKKVYDETDIFSVTSAYDDSSRRIANLQLLLEYAQSYEESSSDGVAGFLRYIDYISKSGGDFDRAYTVTESENAVTVKTIHKSKGLEYPFIFLCQTGKRFNRKDLNGALGLNTDGGVGINFLDQSKLVKHTTVFADYIRIKNESEMISEELRLLYVALTRAKEKLFVVLNKNEKSLSRAMSFAYSIDSPVISPAVAGKANCFADWLYMALLRHPSVTEALSDRIQEDLFEAVEDPSYPDIVCYTPLVTDRFTVDSESDIISPPDPELSRRLREAFSFEYDRRLVENEAKLTVTELIKEEYLDFFADMPTIGDEFTRLTAAQKGTITHKFMQLCDFKLAAADLEGEIARLTAIGQFTGQQADAIDRRSVSSFFGSEIYKRMEVCLSVMREKQFIVRFDDIDIPEYLAIMYKGTSGMLQGIADCLFEEPDGYVLVDYKTDNVKSEQELLDRYASQLVLYKAAFGGILDKPIKSAYIYSFRLARGIEVPL